jgi:hypothetical protein
MPATYRIDVPSRLVIITWPAAEPDLAEWRVTLDTVFADPTLQPGFSILSDWRLGIGAPTSTFIEAFVHTLGIYHARGLERWATVIPQSSVAFGVGRMAEIQAQLRQVNFRAFVDYDEAYAWLVDGRNGIDGT